jgi:diguanylate cyclase (GGDEF)-like protein
MMHENETARLAKLASFGILDTPDEREYDTLTWLAQRLLNCPITAVSLVDDHRQWFKSRQGIDAAETPRSMSFCAHALHYDEIMVIEDALNDERFADNPLVTGDPNIRFYAGVPLRPSTPGHADDLPGIGALCIADSQPRVLMPEEITILRDLANMVSTLIQARASADAALKLATLLEERANEVDRKNRQLRQAERLAGIGSWRLDLGKQAIEWSDHVFAIHALRVGMPPSLEEAVAFYPPGERMRIAAALQRSQDLGEPFDFESDIIRADGIVRRVRSIGEPELVEGRPIALLGVFQDVTDQHRQVETLRRSASTDSLTGLPNRAAFEQVLDDAIADALAEPAPLALLLIDLDGFKAVNDSFGHEAGDEVLCMMAQRLKGTSLSQAFSARLGGDEFVMLISRPRDCAELERVVETVLAELTCSITRGNEERRVSATVGAALWETDWAAETLIRNADLALYQAKRHKRGTGRIFAPERVLPA